MFTLWIPPADHNTTIILFPFAIAAFIAILAIFYWASHNSHFNLSKEGDCPKCPNCGYRMYLVGNNNFKCSHCGTILPYTVVAENTNIT